MKLLVGAAQEARSLKRLHIVLRREGDMGRRHADAFRDRLQPAGKRRLHRRGVDATADQQARPGCRRERHGGLQLRVIVTAGALERIGPAVVEHIFALAVRFHIAGDGAENRSAGVFQPEVMTLPAGLAHGAAGLLQDVEKIKRDERVVGGFGLNS
jgi:hypothetical protein